MLRVFAVAFGLVWGSFLNVVIYRVPRGMSVSRPASHCPACGQPIRAWNNIPVVSFLLMRGRARCCGARVSWRYPAVELLGGLLSWAVLEVIVFGLAQRTPWYHALAVYGASFALALGLVAAAFIDLEHMIVPDSVSLGGTVLGLATFSLRDLRFVDCALGALVGFVVVWLPFDFLYKRVRGKAGMGLGDAKLLMLAGAWFGWSGALLVLGAGAVQGSLATLAVLMVRGKLEEPEAVRAERAALHAELETLTGEDQKEEREALERELAEDPLGDEPESGAGRARVAFGPFLILATLELLLLGRERVLGWLSGE
ncbi:MAG: prepilin peptidase [Myxococcales bacterium]|nr:prepilin peptidase [Myxococcales bacterium]